MSIQYLDTLQYSTDRKGPFKLYVFDEDGYHSGGKWFRPGAPKYPDEELTIKEAQIRTESAEAHKQEVRICDGGDMLVYHSVDGEVIYPAPPSDFWKEVAS